MQDVDTWYVSMYHEGYPMGAACFDELMTRLAKAFPGKKIGIGEFDYWLPDTDHVWWWLRPEDPAGKTRREFLEWHYAAAAGYDQSVLGGFWWGYLQEMYPQNELWGAAQRLFQEMNPKEMQVEK